MNATEKPRLFRVHEFGPIYWGTADKFWLYRPKRANGEDYRKRMNSERECRRRSPAYWAAVDAERLERLEGVS